MACVFFLVSQLANSTGDAIKFSGVIKDWKRVDLIWHVNKYLIDRPCLFLSGLFAYKTIEMWFLMGDLFHYTNELLWLTFTIAISFFVWQLNYRLWRKLLLLLFKVNDIKLENN